MAPALALLAAPAGFLKYHTVQIPMVIAPAGIGMGYPEAVKNCIKRAECAVMESFKTAGWATVQTD